jgi:hypothetical protein
VTSIITTGVVAATGSIRRINTSSITTKNNSDSSQDNTNNRKLEHFDIRREE